MAGFYTVVTVIDEATSARRSNARWFVTRRKAERARRKATRALAVAARVAAMQGQQAPSWNVYVLPAA